MKNPSETQGTLRTRNPAKITPWLHVLARRPDGYHDVRLCLAPVSLYDTLVFGPIEEAAPGTDCQLELIGAEPIGPLGENLVMRAARAFQQALGEPFPWRIRLEKAIPAGAGLGGGSGNAAATLLALNHLAGSPLSRARLAELALGLGSDVTFFLDPRPVLGEGRGERLRPLPSFPAPPVLIVKPPLSIATALAYGRVTPRLRPAPEELPRLDSLEALLPLLANDFETPLFLDHPELAAIKARLLALGAAGALLSGSGSALFGLFRDAAARDRAARAIQDEGRWRAWPCAVLPRHDYGPRA